MKLVSKYLSQNTYQIVNLKSLLTHHLYFSGPTISAMLSDEVPLTITTAYWVASQLPDLSASIIA